MQRFEAYEDIGGEWRWRLLAAEEIVATSGEAFPTQAAALRAAERTRLAASGAVVASRPGLGIAAAVRFRALLQGRERAVAGGNVVRLDSERRKRGLVAVGDEPGRIAR